MGLPLREGHLDGVEIGAIGWQEQDSAVVGFEHLRGGIALLGGEVVKDDGETGVQLGDQDLFDVRVEGVPVHSAGDHPRYHDPITRQIRDQGLVAPPPERRCALETRATQAALLLTRHFGICACLLKKDQPMRVRGHDLLAPLPVLSRLSHLGLAAFFGDQALSYEEPWRRRSASNPLVEAVTSWAASRMNLPGFI